MPATNGSKALGIEVYVRLQRSQELCGAEDDLAAREDHTPTVLFDHTAFREKAGIRTVLVLGALDVDMRLHIAEGRNGRGFGIDVDPIDELERGARPRLVDVGPRWIDAQLPDAGAVIAARPDLERMARQDRRARATGVVIFGPHEAGGSARVEVRAFAPSSGIGEDPVCGSGNGCMAVYLRDSGQVQRFGEVFVASQGQVVGRDGRVRLAISPDRITVGGSAVTCIDGSLRT